MVTATAHTLTKLMERVVREQFFNNACTYRDSLYEFYSNQFKRLAVAPTMGYREYSINQVFTRSTLQFGNQFGNYASPNFGWYLTEYYGSFTEFHNNEASQEH